MTPPQPLTYHTDVISHPLRRAWRTPLGILAAAVILLGADYAIVQAIDVTSADWPAYRLQLDMAAQHAGDGLFLGLLGAVVWGLGALAWRRRVELAGKWMVGAVLLSGFWSQVLKVLIGRPRPRGFVTEGLVWPSGPFYFHGGFPSGHAMTSFALAPLLAAMFPKAGRLFFVLAGLIAIGRVYGGDHYPTDVLVGGWIGYRLGLFVAGQWRLQCESEDA